MATFPAKHQERRRNRDLFHNENHKTFGDILKEHKPIREMMESITSDIAHDNFDILEQLTTFRDLLITHFLLEDVYLYPQSFEISKHRKNTNTSLYLEKDEMYKLNSTIHNGKISNEHSMQLNENSIKYGLEQNIKVSLDTVIALSHIIDNFSPDTIDNESATLGNIFLNITNRTYFEERYLYGLIRHTDSIYTFNPRSTESDHGSRKWKRFPCDDDFGLKLTNGTQIINNVLDISFGGVFFATQTHKVEVHHEVELVVFSNKRQSSFPCVVTRKTDEGVALQIDENKADEFGFAVCQNIMERIQSKPAKPNKHSRMMQKKATF